MPPKLITLFAAFLFVSTSFAQNTFLRFYPGQFATNSSTIYVGSIPTSFDVTPDGGFVIGGFMVDPDTLSIQKMLIRKVDASGNQVWVKHDRVTLFDEIDKIVVHDDGSIFCATRFGSNLGLVKRNSNGDILWAKTLLPNPDSCSMATAMLKTREGNILIAANTRLCANIDLDMEFILLDTAGNTLWHSTMPTPERNGVSDITEAPDSTFYFAGSVEEVDSTGSYIRSVLGRLNKEGSLLFSKKYGESEHGMAIGLNPNSNVVMCGQINSVFIPPGSNSYTRILSDTGSILHQHVDSFPNANFPTGLSVVQNNAHLLQYYYNSNPDTTVGMAYFRYNTTTGQVIFSKNFGLLGEQNPKAIKAFPNGIVAILFHESDSICHSCTGLVLVDSTGCVTEWCYTSMPNIAAPAFKVYPNPYSGRFKIEGIKSADVILSDLSGRVLWQQSAVSEQTALTPPPLPAGGYLLYINSNNQQSAIKLFKLSQ